ncbi:MAG TPA: hypothetical protein DCG57_16735 [Candidatus Riflebacteria bacterium]|nr:hypothetical protein [Candidatus Riflebacteria bacterium]
MFQYIDCFVTDSGRDYVKDLIKNGARSAAQVAELQSITGYFYKIQDSVEFSIQGKMVQAFEEYLNSNYTPVDLTTSFNSYLQAFYNRHAYPEKFVFLKSGITQTLQLVSDVSRYIAAVRQQGEESEAVGLLFEEFIRICAAINFDKIYEKFASPGFHDVFVADYLLRIQNRENLGRLGQIVAIIDGHVAMAAATRKNSFVFPEIIDQDERKIEIHDLYHPFLAKPVKNDFSLKKGSNLLFLTGPNMAGKTTYMKSLGIALILAHVGMGVPAAAMQFSVVDQLFLQLTVHDDIRQGVSSFYREILQIRRIVELLQSGRRLMVIIDEIFKGTNVTDALECSKTVINGFARFSEQFFLISSHLYELQPHLAGSANVQFRCFAAKPAAGRLSFSYKLQDGVSDVRIGTRILAEAGITSFLNKE